MWHKLTHKTMKTYIVTVQMYVENDWQMASRTCFASLSKAQIYTYGIELAFALRNFKDYYINISEV